MDTIRRMQAILNTSSTSHSGQPSQENEGTPLHHQTIWPTERHPCVSTPLTNTNNRNMGDCEGMTPEQRIQYMSLQVELYKLQNPTSASCQTKTKNDNKCKKCGCTLTNDKYENCYRCYKSSRSNGYSSKQYKGYRRRYYNNYERESYSGDDNDVMEFFV